MVLVVLSAMSKVLYVKSWYVSLVLLYAVEMICAEDMVNNCGVRFEDNGACACSLDSEYQPVTCRNGNTIQIQPCHCMYFDPKQNISIVGSCYSSCYEFDNTYVTIASSEEFNADICDQYGSLHRMGRFCGQCNNTYGLAMYSYQIFSCIPCEDYGYKNWLKYFAVALLPLTVFYVLALLLSFNVTSSSFSGILLISQCLTSPVQMKIIASNPYANRYATILKIITSVVCTVNLNFFRLVYPPFCVHPKASIVQILSLEYIIAVYPFLLIFITYVLVAAYDREYRLLLYIWKPFKMCLHCYHKTWNIRTSLIEMFATFTFLSSVKILGVSFQILSFTVTYDVEGKIRGRYYHYYDATIEYLGYKHLPFAILAIVVSFIFVVLPLFFLTFYPCGCFQRCLNHCGGRCQPLHVFMDAFQGSYRTQPRDLRSFSAFYLLLRLLILAQALISTSLMFYTSGILSLMGAAVVCILQPYKMKAHNTIDTVLLLLMGIYFISYYNMIVLTSLNYSIDWITSAVCQALSLALIILYFVLLLLWKLLHLKILALFRKVNAAWNSINQQNARKEFIASFDRDDDSDVSENLSQRLLDSVMPTY